MQAISKTSLVNKAFAFIVAIYVLLSKETFRRQIKKVINAFFNERQTNVIVSVVKESDKIFGGFISGKIIDSFIIGVICFVCCLILRMPYVALVVFAMDSIFKAFMGVVYPG